MSKNTQHKMMVDCGGFRWMPVDSGEPLDPIAHGWAFGILCTLGDPAAPWRGLEGESVFYGSELER